MHEAANRGWVMSNADERSVSAQLSRLWAVTDRALAHLDLDELLSEMLERVRNLLAVDTAAVLLLDSASQQLIATAAKGLEEEVRQGVRIPVGKGFAGKIALERRPVILEKVDHTVVMNHLLWEKGIRSLLGVPLLVGGSVLGVLHVGTLTSRPFSEDDVRILQLVADRLALATQSRISENERAAARALRRSLLPPKLPSMPGLELASRYVPGEHGVGGDWYDVFPLPSGAVGVVIGDVAGHGLPSAVVMGRMRSALRAYSLESEDPAQVLSKLDRKAQHFEAGTMVTVLYAVLDPPVREMRVSSAGHPAPVRYSPGGEPAVVEVPLGLPVGVQPTRRNSMVLDIAPGTLFCFYSDGLVERRRVPIDDQLKLLCSSITTTDPESACAAVMGKLVGSRMLEDDLTILMLRCGSA